MVYCTTAIRNDEHRGNAVLQCTPLNNNNNNNNNKSE
jgi:hypothetical protein